MGLEFSPNRHLWIMSQMQTTAPCNPKRISQLIISVDNFITRLLILVVVLLTFIRPC